MREHYVVLVTTAPALHGDTLALASRLAARSNAVLLFLHVVPLQSSDGEGQLHAVADAHDHDPHDWARSLVPSDGGVRYRHRFEFGDPEAIVADFVQTHDVDIVVAEEPPRSWISAALWRGIAERLVHRVSAPVLIAGPHMLRADGGALPQPTAWHADPGELLNALVEARAEALCCWLDGRAAAVRVASDSEVVNDAVDAAHRRRGMLEAGRLARLRVELDEHARALRAMGWRLLAGGRAWSSHEFTPTPCRSLSDFLDRLAANDAATSLPIALDGDLDHLAILSGARIDTRAGDGLLLFAFEAEDDFLRILGQPGPLPSFETYAFDSEGMMLSHSRFPEHLCAAGLLPGDDLQAPLRVRVAEPSDGPPEDWPLTRMARDATRHQDGSDTRGYLDYRGTPVVGAWRWLARYGFGIAAEVDRGASSANRQNHPG